MPELPDLQAASRNLDKKLQGKIVKKFTLTKGSRSRTSAAAFKKNIEGQKISKVYRDGKQLRILFSNKTILGMHLMLHGELKLFEGKNENKHVIFEIIFTDNTGITLTDWQRAASPSLNPEAGTAPDALDKEMNIAYLRKILDSKGTIKNILLDQEAIKGIGNAYADEILWEARISPQSVGNKIPDAKIKDLAKAIKSVLKDAEKQILKSHPDILTGEVRDFLKIHNAKKKLSPTGAPIQKSVAGSRKTYYTKEQEKYV